MDSNEALTLVESWDKRQFISSNNQLVLEVCKTLKDACDKYRALYEGAEKRIQLYRDVAGKPDIPSFSLNKEVYSNAEDLKRAYSEYCDDCVVNNEKVCPMEEWMFFRHYENKRYVK